MENIFEKIVELQKTGKSFVLATVINSDLSTPRDIGARMAVLPTGQIFGTIGGGDIERTVIKDAIKMMADGTEKIKKNSYDLTSHQKTKKDIPLGMMCGGKTEVMMELYCQDYELVVCGGGHICENLAKIADMLEIRYVVIDNRPEFANEKRFPRAAKIICGDFEKTIKELNITSKTAIVIVTYGHKYDYVCLRASITTPAYYIGMIGSATKVGELFKMLKKDKLELSDKVYSPIGLDIGCFNTPAEISISIIAEMLKVKNNASGKSLRISC
ncbi:MAG: putative xanthine dehydrogenase subunit A [Elusimicrobia bacterium ADurb.Bin231]|nr:MAG: putative xanthine dehydrogenase subunit A [Elusimicrobia bacterium ADurb.Bin231]